MSGVLEAFLLTFAGLFPIVNPIEGAPFFLGMTAGVSSAERQVLARKVAFNGFLLLLGSIMEEGRPRAAPSGFLDQFHCHEIFQDGTGHESVLP